jgi:hypothetical protein
MFKIPPMCPFSTASGLIMVKVLLVAILFLFLKLGAKIVFFMGLSSVINIICNYLITKIIA